jgi:pre-mRNA-splicing helicase BRR2
LHASFCLTPPLCSQNSNLVLTAETRTREATEPSGEPETLWGKMKGKMGDRVQYSKPEEDRKAKAKKK